MVDNKKFWDTYKGGVSMKDFYKYDEDGNLLPFSGKFGKPGSEAEYAQTAINLSEAFRQLNKGSTQYWLTKSKDMVTIKLPRVVAYPPYLPYADQMKSTKTAKFTSLLYYIAKRVIAASAGMNWDETTKGLNVGRLPKSFINYVVGKLKNGASKIPDETWRKINESPGLTDYVTTMRKRRSSKDKMSAKKVLGVETSVTKILNNFINQKKNINEYI